MEISMFGSLAVRDGDRCLGPGDFGGAKPKQLFEILLLARGRLVPKEAVAEALWSTTPPRNVAATLDTYVCVLRHRLTADQTRARRIVVTGPHGYFVDRDEVHVDVDRFDLLVSRAERAPRPERRDLFEQAVDGIGGELLEDEPYACWVHEDRLLYRERVVRAHLAAARECLAAVEPAVALRHGESALRLAPFSEEAFRVVMVADHALGHDEMARGAFARCRAVLGNELGVDPTTETVEVAASIDAGVPAPELIAVMTGQAPSAVPVPEIDLRSSHSGVRSRATCGWAAGWLTPAVR